MENSRRDFFIDMVVFWFIFNNNQIKLLPVSSYTQKITSWKLQFSDGNF